MKTPLQLLFENKTNLNLDDELKAACLSYERAFVEAIYLAGRMDEQNNVLLLPADYFDKVIDKIQFETDHQDAINKSNDQKRDLMNDLLKDDRMGDALP